MQNAECRVQNVWRPRSRIILHSSLCTLHWRFASWRLQTEAEHISANDGHQEGYGHGGRKSEEAVQYIWRARGGGELIFLRVIGRRDDGALVVQVGAFSRRQRRLDGEIRRARSQRRNEERNEPAPEILHERQRAASGHDRVTARPAGSAAAQRGENPVPIQCEMQTNEHHEYKI
jgi:hypothetical protein